MSTCDLFGNNAAVMDVSSTELVRIELRKPCGCSGTKGVIKPKGFQDCVFCDKCGKFQYNAPRVETGRSVRNCQSIHALIKPKQRSCIIANACGRCEMCGCAGSPDNPLEVEHLLTVDAGLSFGMTEAEINCAENMACCCRRCQCHGKMPIPLKLAVAIVLRRIRNGEPT